VLSLERIDYLFCEGARLRVKGSRVVATETSDHRPSVVSFDLNDVP
jgi:endonuclease/exonuclease/phosphatase (EEP) superfamily protein YafD